MFGDGDQSREFTYVENIVEGKVPAMAAEGSAAGCSTSRPGDMQQSQADISVAESWGFWPPVPVEAGLRYLGLLLTPLAQSNRAAVDQPPEGAPVAA